MASHAGTVTAHLARLTLMATGLLAHPICSYSWAVGVRAKGVPPTSTTTAPSAHPTSSSSSPTGGRVDDLIRCDQKRSARTRCNLNIRTWPRITPPKSSQRRGIGLSPLDGGLRNHSGYWNTAIVMEPCHRKPDSVAGSPTKTAAGCPGFRIRWVSVQKGLSMRASRPQAVSGPRGCNTIVPSEHRSREVPPSVSLPPAMRRVDVMSDERLQQSRERGCT